MSTRRPLSPPGSTAAVSLGLFALAVACGWLGPDVDRGAEFCEVSDGPLDQPVNTLSNLGFVVAGLAHRAARDRPAGWASAMAADCGCPRRTPAWWCCSARAAWPCTRPAPRRAATSTC